VDESVGGFAVRVDKFHRGKPLQIEVGDTLLLQSAKGNSKVRVVRVREESSSDRIEAGGGQADGCCLIVGLQRLEDIVDDGRLRAKILAGLPKNLGVILDSTTMLAVSAIVAICVAGLWTAIVVTGEFDEDPHGPAALIRERVASWFGTDPSQEPAPEEKVAETPAPSEEKTRSQTGVTLRSNRPRPQHLPRTP
jgi:hypothetical protein